jgi:hypothetical protein
VLKDGTERTLGEPSTTVGFAIARRGSEGADQTATKWIARTRLALGGDGGDAANDPTTVILGLRPGEALPPEQPERGSQDYSDSSHDDNVKEVV